jgi:DNA-binding MarR family transcriptional regulator
MKTIEEEIQQEQFRCPHQKAVINLIFTANWLFSKQQAWFKPFGITAQQFNILRILKGQYPKSISATEIKGRMLDRNSDISRLLDRLISKNLVEKKTCPSDKRAADVFITTAGLELLATLEKQQKEIDFILTLSDAEATQLSDLLDKCRG